MIIAGTSAILATIDSDTAEYADCVEILTHLHRPMLVSHMVVAEVDYLLTTRFGVPTANRFLADVARGAWELTESTADDINDVITVNTRYQALALGGDRLPEHRARRAPRLRSAVYIGSSALPRHYTAPARTRVHPAARRSRPVAI